MTDLLSRWHDLFDSFDVPPEAARATFDQLATRYAEPWRHYHTLEHIASMIGDLDRAAAAVSVPDLQALLFAAFFHDVVYNPHATDNEERSADHADTVLSQLGVPAPTRAVMRDLILKTKRHLTESNDLASQLFLDADLAILGADASAYDRYAAQIRQEDAWVPEADYQAGRRAVLGAFLAQPQIFWTTPFRDRETAARQNLAREIAGLAPK
jgi:predicted metal-dependent HD superfamily phosphohydrolase